MSINVNPDRNRPSSEGNSNDPNLRDESAAQPGISTVSSSDTDYANQETTQSVSDDPETSDFDDELDDEDFDDEEEEVEGEEEEEEDEVPGDEGKKSKVADFANFSFFEIRCRRQVEVFVI